MFRFSTPALPWLPKIWSSASALSLLPKIWSSTSVLSFCIDCKKCEIPLLQFRSALTAKYVKFCFRTSALPWLAKIWSSTFRTCSARPSKDVKFCFRFSSLPGLPNICSFTSALSLNLDCQRSEDRLLHYHSAFIAKYGKFASALSFCLDCKRSVVSHFRYTFIPKDVNALLLCLDCQSSALDCQSSAPLFCYLLRIDKMKENKQQNKII